MVHAMGDYGRILFAPTMGGDVARAHGVGPTTAECITGAMAWRPHKLPVVGIIFNF